MIERRIQQCDFCDCLFIPSSIIAFFSDEEKKLILYMTSYFRVGFYGRFIEPIGTMNSVISFQFANMQTQTAACLKLVLSCYQAHGSSTDGQPEFDRQKLWRRLERTRFCILLHHSSTSVLQTSNSNKISPIQLLANCSLYVRS